MTDNDGNVIGLWQSQSSEGFRMSPQEIQMKLQALDQAMRRRTRGGYLVCAFLIIAFSVWALIEHDVVFRLAAAASILAVAYLGVQVHRNRSRAGEAPATPTPSIDHLRRELQRQADFHRGKTFWSRMALLGPAGLFFYFAFARVHPEVIAMIRLEIVMFILIMMVAIPLNLRMAKKYQRQIDELDRHKETA